MKTDKIEYKKSSGNVFKDLGIPNPELAQLKSALSFEIFRILNERQLTQSQAAKILGIDQPQVSRLKNGEFVRFSVDRLMTLLNKLDHDINISITKHSTRSKSPAGVNVTAM